ncbi:hypothetical protein [Nodularia sp. UHCC 0506]|uniref:hypothetical protein n=1 Tax=Nodularia sp. UHCC 0506 TaxID=3110243 RepID=UPI002B218CE7|nr:hypothetical protein [Nodularia sp. UHCC 0506]MEA5512520.1 hypothetical protein [Nodularia sp. UHCC 0506]
MALTVSQLFLSTPASAKQKGNPDDNRGRRPSRSRVVTPVKNTQERVVRLSNGSIRLPNGQIVTANRLIRVRNRQDYYRLPNGDFLLPNQQIVPARNTVRLQNNYYRLPSGIILII